MTEQNAHFNIEQRVRETISHVFQLSTEESQGELRMGNHPKWDSMGHMQLIMELENEFGLTFPTYLMAELITTDAIVHAIDAYGAK